MIGIYGQWGEGKTLSMVALIHKRFLKNPDIVVFTNVPLQFEPHKKTGKQLKQYIYYELMDLRSFFLYAVNTPHALLANETIVLIDEASVMLSSRTFAQLPTFMISFLAQARHINTDFYFTTQGIMRVEKIVRELTDYWIQCRRIPILHWIIQQKQYATIDLGRVYQRLRSTILYKPKKYYSMYDTYHIVDFGEHQEKQKEKDHQAKPELNEFLVSAYEMSSSGKKTLKTLKIPFFENVFQKFSWFIKKNPEKAVIQARDQIYYLTHK